MPAVVDGPYDMFRAMEQNVLLEGAPRRWSQPYPLLDFARVLVRNATQRPVSKHQGLTNFLARDDVVDPEVVPALRLVFLGDLMPIGQRRLVVGDALGAVLSGADHLVANFEGVLWAGPGRPPKVFASQRHHDLRVAETLAELLPADRIVLSLANNHAADFGRRSLQETRDRLRGAGFDVIGTVERPGTLLGDRLHVAAATRWSNQPSDDLPFLGTGPDPLARGLIDPDAEGNLLIAHWGVEVELYPRPDTIATAHQLLDHWDAVIGHHPHVPNPISSVDHGDRARLVAWSLGQASSFLHYPIYRRGLVVTAEVGPRPDGAWSAGAVSWQFISMRADDHEVHVDLRPTNPWFPGR
jgi:hypothetical protein